jgi:glutathione peroxidase-family protein
MKRLLTLCLIMVAGAMQLAAQGIYDIRVKNDTGQEVSLSDYRVIARYEPTATVKDMELDIRTQLLTK